MVSSGLCVTGGYDYRYKAMRFIWKMQHRTTAIFGGLKKIRIFVVQNGGLAQLARALAWHARGHRFDPGILHTIRPLRAKALPGSGKAFFMDGPDPIRGCRFGYFRIVCGRIFRIRKAARKLLPTAVSPERELETRLDRPACRYAPRVALQESVLRSLPAMLYRGRGVDRQEK